MKQKLTFVCLREIRGQLVLFSDLGPNPIEVWPRLG